MKVILCEDVDDLGLMGDTVSVARGYARNFLLPRNLAVPAESASAQQIEHELRIIKKREETKRAELGGVGKKLADLKIELTARVGEEGKLFGSVTSLHIAKKLAEMGHPVDRKKIKLKDPIKSVGDHGVPFQLMKDVEGLLKVTVIGEVVEEAKEVLEDDIPDFDNDDEMTSMAAAEDFAARPPRKPRKSKSDETEASEEGAAEATAEVDGEQAPADAPAVEAEAATEPAE